MPAGMFPIWGGRRLLLRGKPSRRDHPGLIEPGPATALHTQILHFGTIKLRGEARELKPGGSAVAQVI